MKSTRTPAVIVLSAALVTSALGQTEWTKYDCNPVLEPSADSWDQTIWAGHDVLFDGAMYRMWYAGRVTNFEIGHATSQDGTHWTKDPEPVLKPGDQGDWDSDGVFLPVVLSDGRHATVGYSIPPNTPGTYTMSSSANGYG